MSSPLLSNMIIVPTFLLETSKGLAGVEQCGQTLCSKFQLHKLHFVRQWIADKTLPNSSLWICPYSSNRHATQLPIFTSFRQQVF